MVQAALWKLIHLLFKRRGFHLYVNRSTDREDHRQIIELTLHFIADECHYNLSVVVKSIVFKNAFSHRMQKDLFTFSHSILCTMIEYMIQIASPTLAVNIKE